METRISIDTVPRPSGILPDWMIRKYVHINPLEEGGKREGKISYGLDSYGYSVRLGYKFKIFSNVNCAVVDPKQMDPRAFIDVDVSPQDHSWNKASWESEQQHCYKCGQSCYDIPAFMNPCKQPPDHILIPPNSFALGETIEYFDVPRDIIVIGIGKSTYARCGVILNVTPAEPEWRGKLTLEISNTTPLPVKVYAGEGIAQLIFFRTLATCETSYSDKNKTGSKYQDQTGLTLPRVD